MGKMGKKIISYVLLFFGIQCFEFLPGNCVYLGVSISIYSITRVSQERNNENNGCVVDSVVRFVCLHMYMCHSVPVTGSFVLST